MKIRHLRWLLLPFSLLYGMVIWLRNLAYDTGVFKSTSFDLPVMVVGNLAVGGAGKSPITEYLIRLFKSDYQLAVLSRGYGRKTRGFRLVRVNDDAALSGDEPLQFKQHFPDQTIAVCESRVAGIRQLQQDHELVILDDAYQHRSLKPNFQLLLFEYSTLKKCDFLLPAGNLREPIGAKNRADILVVTKSPKGLSPEEKLRIRQQLKPAAHQALFFSYLSYADLISLDGGSSRKLESLHAESHILLLSGIANPAPLLQEIRRYTPHILHHEYADHHPYSPKNIRKLAADFEQMPGADKLIITTEKDAQRLQREDLLSIMTDLPVFILPVEADFEEPDKEDIEHLLKQHVRSHSKHYGLHPKKNK